MGLLRLIIVEPGMGFLCCLSSHIFQFQVSFLKMSRTMSFELYVVAGVFLICLIISIQQTCVSTSIFFTLRTSIICALMLELVICILEIIPSYVQSTPGKKGKDNNSTDFAGISYVLFWFLMFFTSILIFNVGKWYSGKVKLYISPRSALKLAAC